MVNEDVKVTGFESIFFYVRSQKREVIEGVPNNGGKKVVFNDLFLPFCNYCVCS